MKSKITILIPLFLIFLFSSSVIAQESNSYRLAMDYIHSNMQDWGYSEKDIATIKLLEETYSSHNGVVHAYLIQTIDDVAIHNASANISILKNGKVLGAKPNFIRNLDSKIKHKSFAISETVAMDLVAGYYNLSINNLEKLDFRKEDVSKYHSDSFSVDDFFVKKEFIIDNDGLLVGCWSVEAFPVGQKDLYITWVDASSGEIIKKSSLTTHCSFDNAKFKDDCSDSYFMDESYVDNADEVQYKYNVVPFPGESPAHKPREVLTAPSDTIASPHGWHDINGDDIPDFTITKGNNVHAYLDIDDNNISQGDEPDGGADLIFDFPFDQSLEPTGYQPASVTNLFYANNFMHDFTYRYGFDEVNGNFQSNNFGKGGYEDDYVKAEGQDGSGTDNANFSTPSDGGSGRMQMYLWSRANAELLHVDAPEGVAGDYKTGTAGFGEPISEDPLTGTVVIVDDGNGLTTDACQGIENVDEINGNIALIDRGTCEFGFKILNAEQAGAIAVIICNYEDELISMGAGAVGNSVTIPSVFMRSSDCQVIRQFANGELVVTLQKPSDYGPTFLDADFDNGVMSHEYGHGVSNRLVSSPGLVDCLQNAPLGDALDGEQMGEGWSDFFTLVTATMDGDVGEDVRGIGNYLIREDAETGKGIRPYPYSTDMDINPVTYEYIKGLSVPHGVGSVWASMLWDLYWAFVDEYGWDSNQIDGDGGNNKAIQVIMDGMNMTPCQPDFIEARDAILAADIADFDGANQCLIWEVFARRGLGYSADAGEETSWYVGGFWSRSDGTEAFDLSPECRAELIVEKTVSESIIAGQNILVTVNVGNYKGFDLHDVIIEELLEDGLSYVVGSASVDESIEDGHIIFNLGDLASLTDTIFTYEISTVDDMRSTRVFLDDVEDDLADYWDIAFNSGTTIWEQWEEEAFAHSGSNYWAFLNVGDERNDQFLYSIEPFDIEGSKPVFRFWHRYNIEPAFDGGVVEISTDNLVWESVDDKIFRNPYDGLVLSNAFFQAGRRAFYGPSEEYKSSYIDLSEYIGQSIYIRFRMATDDSDLVTDYWGWFIDDIEIIDMVNYNSEICVSSVDLPEDVCVIAKEKGTIVEPSVVATSELESSLVDFDLFPNPTSSGLSVIIPRELSIDAMMIVYDISGKEIISIAMKEGRMNYKIDTKKFEKGMYILKILSKEGVGTKRFVVE